jgi:hypothetical protein
MMRKLTKDEALEMLEFVFNVAPDADTATEVEALVAGICADRAQQDVNSYLAILPIKVDPDTIQIKHDKIEGAEIDCAFIKIFVEDHP